jgi:DNA-binding Lrp family transcriptional regulator
MELDSNADAKQIFKFFSEHTYLVEPSTCLGKYDLQAVIYAEDITKLNERIDMVKRLPGIKKVIVSVWSGIPCLDFNNISLTHKERK